MFYDASMRVGYVQLEVEFKTITFNQPSLVAVSRKPTTAHVLPHTHTHTITNTSI